MKKKKVLVCGASGFIGRNVFEDLLKRDDVEVYGTYHSRNFLPENPRLIQADLTDKNTVFEITKGIDVIIQAAATTSGAKEICTKPYYHVTDNAIMNSLLFRAAYEHSVSKVVFFSCTVMYPTVDYPIKETDLNLNDAIYEKYFGVAWTKLYIEKMCEFYSRLGRTNYTVIRHSNIYGPHDKFDLEKSHVFGATITKVMTANDDKIVVWGEGKEERDLLYISDLVRFVSLALERQSNPFELFNVGLGSSVSVADLVKKIIQASGRKLDLVFDKTKPTLATKFVLNIGKAKQQVGWSPQVTLEEGIQKTLDWYKQNLGN